MHAAGDGFTEAHDARGDAGIVHHNARADKKRDGEQRNALGTGDGLLREDDRVDARVEHKVDRRAAKHRNIHRHLQEQQREHDHRGQDQDTIHDSMASFASDLTPLTSENT